MNASREGRRTCDAVIAGGGIIGLAAGVRLLEAGLSVTVVERGRAGGAASAAAAGMLAPDAEAEPGDAAFLELARAGLAMWPDFARQLRERTGANVELRTNGILMAARGAEEAARLRDSLDQRRRSGAPVEWLDGAAARELEPALAPEVSGALLFPRDGQVNNRRATAALARAFLDADGVLLQATPVTGLLLRGGRAAGVQTDAGPIEAGVVILAAGAWAGSLPGWPPEALPPVHPVKGQMAALTPPRPLPERVVWSVPGPRGVYLVPRSDGRVIIGATVEEAGFDTRVTAGGLEALLAPAMSLSPALGAAGLADVWAGLRPGSPDNIPIAGASPIEGLVWATGHHRNGILLAPLTADAVCRVVTGKPWPPHYRAMDAARPAVSAARASRQPGRAVTG
ncbi:MAG: glycine oxidase ThiO [Alphaproteobacteria bacterium]